MEEAKNNVGNVERIVSVAAGGALAIFGFIRQSLGGALLVLSGSYLVWRGATGRCAAYQASGFSSVAGDTPDPEMAKAMEEKGVHVQVAVTINKPAEELWAFWHKLENLPQFMIHLKSITQTDGTHSHWVAKAPLGASVSWDAETTQSEPGRVEGWQSLPGAVIQSKGEVTFRPAPGGRGTEVRVHMDYTNPAGVVGTALARLFGEEPQVQFGEDMRRYKALMETGETPAVDGQPTGKRSLKGQALDKLQVSHAA